MKIENSAKSNNVYFLNVLQPRDALANAESVNLSIKRLQGDGCTGVEISSQGHTELFLFSSDSWMVYEDLQSGSKWISQVKDGAGNIVKSTSYRRQAGGR